ncbi:MAG: His-Xaa-Ser system radical SAM maturase HxsB [Candidatus Omnitrophica bacterium]|nr:His-Xaa-Ser system radical SAM maturase HxsB [Candidatus Omnitrophota bacterium]
MKKKEFAVIPFNSDRIKDKYLVSNLLGKWDLLDKQEFGQLNSLKLNKDNPLFKRLYDKGIVADESSFKGLIDDFKRTNANLFWDTSLHIAVLTTRCNLGCKYCQTGSLKPEDMSYEVANRVLKYMFDTRNPAVTLEFQGGEPVLNWDVLAFLVKHARKFNVNKDLKLALVSNLTLLDEDKIKFLYDHDVAICSSLDGPEFIQDKNRPFKNGKKTYKVVTGKIRKIKKKFGRKIDLLPTITKESLNFPKKIIDEYIKWEQSEIALRPVNRLGVACSNWLNIGYSPQQFNSFYKKAMDYILELNKKGVYFKERIARVILEKVLGKRDPAYVELMNPCGAGRNTISYMPNGDCYPCDEARMIGEDMFRLGNILNQEYSDMMKKDNLMHLLQSSLMNLWDYNSAFLPWMGTCPVVNYAMQKNIVPKIACSTIHKIYKFQFNYIFEKISESKENLEIFKSWVR